jgi:hypothetical protein
LPRQATEAWFFLLDTVGSNGIHSSSKLWVKAQYAMKTWGSGGIAPPFLTSVLDGDDCSASCPGPFTPIGRAPGTNWLGDWVGHRTGQDKVKTRKIMPLPGLELRTLGCPVCVSPVQSSKFLLVLASKVVLGFRCYFNILTLYILIDFNILYTQMAMVLWNKV